jgi:hypothetical protein
MGLSVMISENWYYWHGDIDNVGIGRVVVRLAEKMRMRRGFRRLKRLWRLFMALRSAMAVAAEPGLFGCPIVLWRGVWPMRTYLDRPGSRCSATRGGPARSPPGSLAALFHISTPDFRDDFIRFVFFFEQLMHVKLFRFIVPARSLRNSFEKDPGLSG